MLMEQVHKLLVSLRVSRTAGEHAGFYAPPGARENISGMSQAAKNAGGASSQVPGPVQSVPRCGWFGEIIQPSASWQNFCLDVLLIRIEPRCKRSGMPNKTEASRGRSQPPETYEVEEPKGLATPAGHMEAVTAAPTAPDLQSSIVTELTALIYHRKTV
ncbi:hypothetical protein NDU88_003115 [Pleurodeles waltl]|uniref:Uncharacterized protein n=1 Tax=Pleurodeles waltl TaxID=8319 RepID=A0AAV7M611_PLEWA|nr:hypothetical protein NDU88_003115 [Pleurodeles waltl]